MSKHGLTLCLLLVLAALLSVMWPDDAEKEAEEGAVAWRLPPPVADSLFEDFSVMPSQGPPARLLPPPTRHPDSRAEKRGERGTIALIIDDVGYDLHVEKQLLALPFPLAISVLPQSPHARVAATLAHDDGRVVMLHLPMEPSNPALRAHLGDEFLRLGMGKAQLQQKIAEAWSRVPFVEGVNNHMGSRLTADRQAMDTVMDWCRNRDLFFVDSRTGSDSVAAQEAKKAGLRWASRRVFLDHVNDAQSIARAWKHAVLLADHHGSCVVIAHPRKKTVAFLSTLQGDDVRRMRTITALLQ